MGFIQYNTQNNLTATTNPSVTDDITLGYEVDSRWYNTSTNQWYVCGNNAAGAALWTIYVNPIGLPTTINNKTNEFLHVEHFVGAINGSILPVTNSSTSGGAVTSVTASSGHLGIRRLTTGATTAASRCQDTVSSAIWFDDGITQMDVTVKPPIAGTVTDGYEMLFGYSNAVGLPASFGVFWYYNRRFYGDDFMRCIMIRGALKVEHTTSIAMGATSIWRQFGVRSNAGIGFAGVRNFEFYYGDGVTSYSLVDTITEAQITTAGISLPYDSTDVLGITYAIQKQATSLVARSMDVDSLIFYKKITG